MHWPSAEETRKSSIMDRARNILTLVVLFHIWFGEANAQLDTTLREYFPLNDGDYWEYLIQEPPPSTSIRFWLKNFGDTLLPNGRTYSEIRGRYITPLTDEIPPEYFRLDDSLRVYSFTSDTARCPEREYIQYDLGVIDETIWPVCGDFAPDYPYRTVLATFSDYYSPLDSWFETKAFGSAYIDTMTGDTIRDPLGTLQDRLGRGVGLIRRLADAVSPMNLVGAIIDGQVYGKPTAVDPSEPEQLNSGISPTVLAYPNPARVNGELRVALADAGLMGYRLVVYDVLGRTIIDKQESGFTSDEIKVNLGNRTFSAGMYLLVLQTRSKTSLTKLLVIN